MAASPSTRSNGVGQGCDEGARGGLGLEGLGGRHHRGRACVSGPWSAESLLLPGIGCPESISLIQTIGMTMRRRMRIDGNDPSRTASYAVVREIPSSCAARVTEIVTAASGTRSRAGCRGDGVPLSGRSSKLSWYVLIPTYSAASRKMRQKNLESVGHGPDEADTSPVPSEPASVCASSCGVAATYLCSWRSRSAAGRGTSSASVWTYQFAGA